MSQRVEQLLQAGNEASARVRNLWITFLLFGTYLAIAIGSTTHRQMLLESPIELPLLGVNLPLVQFYQVAPVLFLVFHFYMLVQLYLLAGKLHGLNHWIEQDLWPETARQQMRQRADQFLITQLLVGARQILPVRLFVGTAAWLTMVAAPVVLLLAFQIRFLPYHDVPTTWLHRSVLIVDVMLLWLMWPVIAHPDGLFGGAVTRLLVEQPKALYRAVRQSYDRAKGEYERGSYRGWLWESVRGGWRFQRLWSNFLSRLLAALLAAAVVMAGSFGVIGFSVLVATIPAEGVERWLLASWEPLRQRALDDEAMRRCLGLNAEVDIQSDWPGNWWLPRLIDAEDKRVKGCTYLASGLGGYLAVEPWFSKRLRGRSITFTHDADMPPSMVEAAKAWSRELTHGPILEADKANAVWWPTFLLFEGEPDPASSKTTSLFSRNLVLIDDSELVSLSDEAIEKTDRTLVLRGRDLRHARFDRSDLRKADLLRANLEGAMLWGTHLSGASLEAAEMQGANFLGAEMQGANFLGAKMQGANFSLAKVQGAHFWSAKMQGANFSQAKMQGANFFGAEMQGANFSDAEMQGANLFSAEMQGANFPDAEMQAADLSYAKMQGTNLSRAAIWMTVTVGTDLMWAETNDFNIDDPFDGIDLAKRREIADETIDGWTNAIPKVGARDAAHERLAILRDPSKGAGGWRPWVGAKHLTRPEEWEDETETGLGTLLGELGCQAHNAPYVARGLLRRISGEYSPFFGEGFHRAYHSIVATSFLNPDCEGAHRLTANERATLQAIADVKP